MPTNGEDGGAALEAKKRISTKLLIVIVASVLVLGTGSWVGYDISQRRDVPDLTGLTLQEAEAAAKELGLAVDLTAEQQVLDLSDANTEVLEQDPAAGGTTRSGSTISFTVVGKTMKVPDLAGISFKDAQSKVQMGEMKLVHEFGENEPLDTWPINAQDPAAGKQGRAGDEITLGFAVPEIAFPQVVGLESKAADDALAAVGLLSAPVGEGTHIASVSRPSTLSPFTRVTLNLGFPMPDVVGKTHAEATSLLSNFTNVKRTSTTARPIEAQSVASGTVIAPDAEITLTVPGPETVYRIIGDGATASVTWAAPGALSIQQANGVDLPWEMRFPTDSGTAVFNAQLGSGGSITCQLERNGVIVKELTSTGAYAVVQC